MTADRPEYEIGKRYPMPPKPKLKINPMHFVDDDRPADVKKLPESYRERKEREPEKRD
jgi:hypothetical protein